MKKIKGENGMLVVEATLVFPMMFLIIFLMIFTGNAYFQKSKVESVVTQMAFQGAAQCGDPLTKLVQQKGSVPSYSEANYEIEPYRYLFGKMGNIENDIKNQIAEIINRKKTGFFMNMKPKIVSLNTKFNNKFLYSTFSVELEYKVPIPIRLLGMRDYFSLSVSSRNEVPVLDTPEFIRNVDMVEDWIESTKKGQEIIGKAKEKMEKISQFIN